MIKKIKKNADTIKAVTIFYLVLIVCTLVIIKNNEYQDKKSSANEVIVQLAD